MRANSKAAKKILEIAGEYGMTDDYLFRTTFERYEQLNKIMQKLQDVINQEDTLTEKEYVKGSLAAMEDLLRQMKETADNQYAPIYILTMTDYDPAGYYIANTFYNQVQDLRAGLGINREVYIRRIGIFPAQLTADEIMQNWYTPKPANLDKWLEETGGINGRAKGLELDALEPDRIRKIFIDNLRPYIEQGQYSDFIKRAYLQRLILDAMRGKIAGIVAAAVNENLGSVEMIQADLMNIAAGGSRYIPTQDLCFTSRGQEIKEKVLAQFV